MNHSAVNTTDANAGSGTPGADVDIEARARRRVGLKIGFCVHALVYVLVNLGLYVLSSAAGGERWSHVPLLGWGLGLAVHAVATIAGLQGDGLRDRMLGKEIEYLRRQRR